MGTTCVENCKNAQLYNSKHFYRQNDIFWIEYRDQKDCVNFPEKMELLDKNDSSSFKKPISKSSLSKIDDYTPKNSRNFMINLDTTSSKIKSKKVIKSSILSMKINKSKQKSSKTEIEKVIHIFDIKRLLESSTELAEQ